MEGHIDTSFQMVQRDLFTSGLAAKIGMNAFGVWLAIKQHADFDTGKAWPGMRRLAELVGISLSTVSESVKVLVDAKLLRVDVVSKGKGRRGNTYTARERLDVRIGERVLCTIVLDYVPATLRARLDEIKQGLKSGKGAVEVFARCEILPGPGFAWDAKSGTLRGAIPAHELPASVAGDDEMEIPLVRRLKAIQERSRFREKKASV